jgi:hypothetical protein
MDMHISLLESLVGFEKTFKHLDDHDVTVVRTSVTSPMQVLMKKGEGMPVQVDPSQKGNLYIKIIVDFPDKLSDDQKQGNLSGSCCFILIAIFSFQNSSAMITVSWWRSSFKKKQNETGLLMFIQKEFGSYSTKLIRTAFAREQSPPNFLFFFLTSV